jgi:hypothetical protein
LRFSISLEGADTLVKVEDFPEGNPDIENSHAAYRSSHPTRSHDALQTIHSSLARGVKQEIVVTPIAEYSQCSLRNPGQEREYQTNLEAENDVEDDTELC